MKSNKFLIASLLILVGMGAITVSCTKEKAGFRKAKLIVENNCLRDGGDDDEDPVIMARIKKKLSFVPIDSAYMETYTYGGNVRVGGVYSNSYGECEQQVVTGTYYFKVTVPGSGTPYFTDTVYINKDRIVTILVD